MILYMITNMVLGKTIQLTSLALLNLLDKTTSAIDKKKYTPGFFLDLSKAFDTVNHESLFEKLEHYMAFEIWPLIG